MRYYLKYLYCGLFKGLNIRYPIKCEDFYCFPLIPEYEAEPRIINYNIDLDDEIFFICFKEEKISPKALKKLDTQTMLDFFTPIITTFELLYCYRITEVFHGIFTVENKQIQFKKGFIYPENTFRVDIQANGIFGYEKSFFKVEKIVNSLLSELLSKRFEMIKAYNKAIAEYVHAKRSNLLEIRLFLSWFALEHLAFNFWKYTEPDRLNFLEEVHFNSVKEALPAIVKDANLIDETKITTFPEKRSNIEEHIIKKLSNHISIRFLIKKFLETFRTNITLSRKEKRKIYPMYSIRNKIIHEGVSLFEIRKLLRDKNPIDFNLHFLKLLEKVFIGFLKLTPSIGQWEDDPRDDRYHHLSLSESLQFPSGISNLSSIVEEKKAIYQRYPEGFEVYEMIRHQIKSIIDIIDRDLSGFITFFRNNRRESINFLIRKDLNVEAVGDRSLAIDLSSAMDCEGPGTLLDFQNNEFLYRTEAFVTRLEQVTSLLALKISVSAK